MLPAEVSSLIRKAILAPKPGVNAYLRTYEHMLLKCRRPGRKPFCAGPLPGTANEYIMAANVNVREEETEADR